jgi:hypothetical protein
LCHGSNRPLNRTSLVIDVVWTVTAQLFRRVWNKRAQRVGTRRLSARIVADIVKRGADRLALDPANFAAHSA